MSFQVLTSCVLSLLLLSQAVSGRSIQKLENYQALQSHEVKELLTKISPDPQSIDRLAIVLNTVVYKFKDDVQVPKLRYSEDLSKSALRVAHWNLSDFKIGRFARLLADTNQSSADLDLLKTTDIFILNSVDWQTEASLFRNELEDFANLLGGHYAFVPEFVEASPRLLQNIKSEPAPKPVERNNPYLKDLESNKYKLSVSKEDDKFRGLHGNAIVSKFPIKQLGKVRLPACYDWFEEEQKFLENRDHDKERKPVKDRAGEGKVRALRRGGRVALLAEVEVPNKTNVLVISTELENRADPDCRAMQLYYLLTYIQDYPGAVILGADLNNFEKNVGPFYLGKAVKETVTDPQVLAKKAISYFNPFALITNISSMVVGGYRKKNNPTVSNVPIFMRNKAAKLFRILEEFEFDDKTKFDFSGIEEFNYSNSNKLLANSNQRASKGFVSTYEYKKLLGKGKVKVDWIFVKPNSQGDFNPVNPRTLSDLNYQVPEKPLSDHSPIVVEVMLK